MTSWNDKLEIDLDELLKKNDMTRKDVKTKTIEYYPNGKVKMKIKYLGTWDTNKCYECGWLDYDEEGKLLIFKTIDDRSDWLHEMDWNYRSQMDEDEIDSLDGIIFPEKKTIK